MMKLLSFRCLVATLLIGHASCEEYEVGVDTLAGNRTVFLGDSITQAGGYVSFVSYFLEKRFPEKEFDIIGMGLSSEMLSGLSEKGHAGGRFPRPCLFERLGRVLEKTKPDVVFACYGMNDGIYLPLDDGRFEAFKDGVKRLISDCKDAGVEEVILITPPIYDSPPKEGQVDYEKVLAAYSEWQKSLKGDGVHVIDLHGAMRKARDARTEAFSKDKVHPGEEGHLLMATTVLGAQGVDLSKESLAAIKADPLFGKVDALRKMRWKLWMNHTGYTREKVVEPQPLGDREAEKKLREEIDKLRK